MAILHYTNAYASECFIPEKLDFEPFLVMFKYLESGWLRNSVHKYVHLISKTKDPPPKKRKSVERTALLFEAERQNKLLKFVDLTSFIHKERLYVQLKFHPDLQLTVITPTITTRVSLILSWENPGNHQQLSNILLSFPFLRGWEENSSFSIINFHPPHTQLSLTSCPAHQTDESWPRRCSHRSPCVPSHRWRRWTCCPPQSCCSGT